MRKPVIAGNWRMYKTGRETSAFFGQFAPLAARASNAEVVVCPPFVNIPAAVEAAQSTRIQIGAQDVFWMKEGAYTGEVPRRCLPRPKPPRGAGLEINHVAVTLRAATLRQMRGTLTSANGFALAEIGFWEQ